MSDKELNAAIKDAKAANEKASFADGSKNKTVPALKKLTDEKKSRTAAKKEASAKETKEKKKVDVGAVNEKLYDMIQASGVKDVQMKADDLSRSGSDVMLIDVYGKNKNMPGMQIIKEDGVYEVSEYGAGPKGEDLLIFGEYKTLAAAVKKTLKGNYTDGGQKPEKVLDGSDGPGDDLYKPFDKYEKEQAAKKDAGKSGGKKDEKMPINPKDWKDESKGGGFSLGDKVTADVTGGIEAKVTEVNLDVPGFKGNKFDMIHIEWKDPKKGSMTWAGRPEKFTAVKEKQDNSNVITEKDSNPQDYKGAKHKSSPGYKAMSPGQQKKVDDLSSMSSVNMEKVDQDIKEQHEENMSYVKSALKDILDEGEEDVSEFRKISKIKDPLDQALAFVTSKGVNDYSHMENIRDSILNTVSQMKKQHPSAFKTLNPNQTRLFKSRVIRALNRI